MATFAGLLYGQQPKQEAEKLPFTFERCPCKAELGDQATVQLPKGTIFIDRENAPKFLEYNHNIPDGEELGIVLGAEEDWFVIYRFDAIGYVKDDEKTSLDADALLRQITEATEEGNKVRRQKGWSTVSVVGWERKPHYDETSHNLEWSIIGQNQEGGRSVNHFSRLLGRKGVLRANLVMSPEHAVQDLAAFRGISGGVSFTPENKYTAFVKGDKVAEYGLTALILGGATAAAAKTGLLKTAFKLVLAFWKIVLVGAAATGGAIWRFLRGLFQKPEPEQGGQASA